MTFGDVSPKALEGAHVEKAVGARKFHLPVRFESFLVREVLCFVPAPDRHNFKEIMRVLRDRYPIQW